jgi:hypothetical protein
VIGIVAVKDLAYCKHVAARFTTDFWKTVFEVSASYYDRVDPSQFYDAYDRFSFEISFNNESYLKSIVMLLCIRYNVNGQEF